MTIVVHGWGHGPAEEFVGTLRSLLRRADAVWLVAAEGSSIPLVDLPRATRKRRPPADKRGEDNEEQHSAHRGPL